jgi:hypothetical protein
LVVPCQLAWQERKVVQLLAAHVTLADQPASPAGRAGEGSKKSRFSGVADQPASPAGRAGEGSGKLRFSGVADQPASPAGRAGRGRRFGWLRMITAIEDLWVEGISSGGLFDLMPQGRRSCT